MLARISSFSGPKSNLFKGLSGFTTTGLILRYEIGLTSSYTGNGTSVVDLVGNSNATLTNGPTYSSTGYLLFDGTNDYLLTSTSLDSKFSGTYPNKSDVTSIFMWIYPIDNGVILTEMGLSSTSSGWHDAQIEMVSGSLEFGMWNGTGLSSLVSSISTPLNNWYYVGMVYDGTKMSAYVNAQLAGEITFDRLAPYNTSGYGIYYGIGLADITNMGDGTYAKVRLGAFHVYNIALTQTQVINNYVSTISSYPTTDSIKASLISSSSLSSYNSASVNEWVKVTAAEWTNVTTYVSSVNKYRDTDANFTVSGTQWGSPFFSVGSTASSYVPSDVYIIGYKIICARTNQAYSLRPYYSDTYSPTASTWTGIGNTMSFTTGGSVSEVAYFIRKSPDILQPGNTFVGIYTTSNLQPSPGSFPTYLSSTPGGSRTLYPSTNAPALQILATTTKSW